MTKGRAAFLFRAVSVDEESRFPETWFDIETSDDV
jgi:hypothetical protein